MLKGVPMRHGKSLTLRQHPALTVGALLLGLLFLLPAAWAAVDRDQAATMARSKVAGRVLAVERGLHIDNSVVWHIKVLTPAGDVRLIVIDAETGRFR
jgi:hypothetical protein